MTMQAMRWFQALVVVLSMTAGSATGQTIGIESLEADPQRYLDIIITVDGRYRSAGAGKLYLHGSDIEFQLGDQARYVRRGMGNVEMRGRLTDRRGKLVFLVEFLQAVPSDIERFDARREMIREGNFSALYELSRWARRRSQSYDNRELYALARKAFRDAFAWELAEARARGDANQLLHLSQRGAMFGLPQGRVDEILHEALWRKYERLAPRDDGARRDLADEIRFWLPGSEVALPKDDGPRHEARKAYLAAPRDVYANASQAERARWHRVFWSELTAASIRAAAERPEADLDQLADEASRLLPDRPELVRELRLRHLDERAARFHQLSRADVLVLRDAFHQWGEDERGRGVVRSWLDRQREQLDAHDAEQRLLLAADYRQLLGAEEAAARLLIEALEIAPELKDAERDLRALGYELRDGRWQLASAEPQRPADRGQRETVPLTAGDPEREVLRRLQKPDRVARVASRGFVTEQWIYDGPPRLYIYLRRNTVTGQAFVLSLHAP